jgi:hypothetical protein
MKSYWREKCRTIIARVIAENKGADEQQIRKALSDAYPFGERKYHPYKVWLDEIAVQMGTKKQKNIFGRKKKAKPRDPKQMELFGEL